MRGLAVLPVILLAFAGCTKPQDEAATTKKEAAPPVKLPLVATVEEDTPDVLTLTGTISADWRSEVTADTQGKVLDVKVERGDRVKRGQPVVMLDVRTAALSQREAQANLEAARAQRQLAETECARSKSLLEKGAITKEEYDRSATQCTSSAQQVSAAEARTQMMAKSVGDGYVVAPFDGVVTERAVSPGEWVMPGKPLFTLVDDDPLRIELSVPESAIAHIKEKQHVDVVTVAYPDKVFSATVTRIGAEIGRSRSLIVEATLDKTPELVPGMFAEARIQIDHHKHPVIPADAVVKRGKTWHAFVDVKGELEDRIVQLGAPPSKDKVSILQGVAIGEKVVAKVTPQVVDGLKVVE